MSVSFQRGLRPEVPDFLPLPTQLYILEAQLIETHMVQNAVLISFFQHVCMSTNLFTSVMPRGIRADGWHYTIVIVCFPKKHVCCRATFYSSAYSCPNPMYIPVCPPLSSSYSCLPTSPSLQCLLYLRVCLITYVSQRDFFQMTAFIHSSQFMLVETVHRTVKKLIERD